ncbi:PIG-L deacetylase family protein [Paenisporosarcina sp. FSL H8-0542]|uniref:PIG-L deacetylase family protein n=1 Tax=Paenisporosarcina sp. FSL H8-0542 TaxID=2921401 RepID=UPI00315AE2A6
MKVLVFAPHNDDEVLGVGGTIAKYAAQGHEVFICEVTKSNTDEEIKEERSEALAAHHLLGVKETIFLDFPIVTLRETPLVKINAEFLKVVEDIRPNIAFIPHKGDMHMDHTVVSHSAMVALRPINGIKVENIYAYETLSETEWNLPTVDNAYMPNVWSDISKFIDIKKEAMNCYQSQLKQPPHPRTLEIIEALAKLRGSTVGVPFAESFMLVRRLI